MRFVIVTGMSGAGEKYNFENDGRHGIFLCG